MDRNLIISATFLTVGLLVSGCAVDNGKSVENNTPLKVSKQKFTAEPGLVPKQRFRKAIEKLENGEEGQALAELKAYLVAIPRSKSAKKLIAQISTDSEQYFPADYFTVNLTSGTSLSTLAKTYLGSALKFYALAKYNDITNPSRVNIGQEIKVPLTASAQAQLDKENALETAKLNPAPIDVPVVAEVTTELAEQTDESELPEVVIEAPVETAESVLGMLQDTMNNKDYATAVEKVIALEAFGNFDKDTTVLAIAAYVNRAQEIAETDNILAASYFAAAGHLNLHIESQLEAFESFRLAYDLDESNEAVMEEMLVLQKEISDQYHREASSAYRRQELDFAIEKWDKVLEVNPDHSSAQLYRAQALELKEKLKNINQD
ncbi:hypothetical protein [uncultured Paraglaciecola sp.]|uniref:hypothetical protein n=1 Tax=uncultured Paraglaciecola sp. TaxID=1765024 RepID=UPI00261863CB|nr:hypothetical protein [uncultured Paraglaciecola sp.]